MTLSLTVLGSSGSYPGQGHACSGYLVQGGGLNLVVDLGPGSLANLQRHLSLPDLDAVVLTHSHPDHWTDLAGLRTARKYGLGLEGLPVYGTAETHDHAHRLCTNLHPTMVWHDVTDGDEVDLGGLQLRFSATRHYVETLAVRIDGEGRSIAYSADTGPGWDLGALGPGIDLALIESTYPTDDEAEGVLHLSAHQAGDLARKADVGRLVLTHLWPESDPDEHRRIGSEAFGSPVEIAIDNERYHL